MKQSKMTLIALVIILIGLALCTIHIVYADNQNSKEASSNDSRWEQIGALSGVALLAVVRIHATKF